jgi:hypothetical protein
MSALGQKQTFGPQSGMSALPPKADVCVATRDVRFGSIADIYATEILGLLHPRVAQAFQELRHRAGGIGDVLFDPRNRIFGVQFLQYRQFRASLLDLAGLR